MCGIVGCIARRQVRDILLEGLKRLEYRGYDSAGVAIIDDRNRLHHHRVCGKVAGLATELKRHKPGGNLGIAHTRWATHGKVTEANAHPHVVGGRIALVHNGIVENHVALRKELMKKGHRFQSETDSETVAVLIYDYLTRGKNLMQAVGRAVKKLDGAFALAVLDKQQPDQLIGVRQDAPLVMGVGSEENFLASDPLALLQVTDRFIYLRDNAIAVLTKEAYEISKIGGGKTRHRIETYQHGHAIAELGDYGHYMLKEIYEQPATVHNTLTGKMVKNHFLPQALGERFVEIIPKTDALYMVGCGTAHNAALTARYWFEEYSAMRVCTEVASEFRYMRKNVPARCLYVTISQSGETADVLAALKSIKTGNRAAFLASLAICNVPSSSLVRACDIPLLIAAGPEIGVASTKAFTAQLIGLLLLLGFTFHIQKDKKQERQLADALQALPGLITKTLALRDQIARAAESLVDKNSILFIGRGALMPLAMEGALKLKEISYIHAEAYPGGELKHGPLALIDEKVPTVALMGDGIRGDKMKSNMQEIAARQGPLLVFAQSADKEALRMAEHLILLPRAHPLTSPILYGVAMQLLAYEVAVKLGTDVDKPRNLAKSVTVE